MALTVNKGGTYRPTTQPYTRAGGSWRAARKTYIKKAGAWVETWPLIPNPPTNVAVYPSQVGQIIVIDAYWGAPLAGASAFSWYAVRLVFHHYASGAESATDWAYFNNSTYSYRFDNGGNGFQWAAGYGVRAEAYTIAVANDLIGQRWSTGATSSESVTPGLPPPPVVVVPPLVAPDAPTSYGVVIDQCKMSLSWAHPGGNNLSYFEIWTWLGYDSPTAYFVGAGDRSFAGQPWDPNTVGRNWVSTQMRAVGQGGASAWVSYAAIMPGPLSIPYSIFQNNVQYTYVQNNYDGYLYWTDYWGSPTWYYKGPVAAGGDNWLTVYGSDAYARDNATYYRVVYQPRNANGWTGRLQGSPYAVKIPNPVYFEANDCNTWWSNPIPGKWRTNPQADDWFYQGKSISGNSYGTLFYRTQLMDYFAASRIGYTPTVDSWWVYIQRTYTGGLASAINLNIWLHNRQDDGLAAAPGLTNGPQNGPSLSRSQQAWIGLSTSWWPNMLSGAARGISFYVDPGASDNQLRSEIGNVSNRYMILNKPHYGATTDHGGAPRKCGTIVVYHNG